METNLSPSGREYEPLGRKNDRRSDFRVLRQRGETGLGFTASSDEWHGFGFYGFPIMGRDRFRFQRLL